MAESKEARNKALVLKAFDISFNKSDYAAAEQCPNVLRGSLRLHRPVRDKTPGTL